MNIDYWQNHNGEQKLITLDLLRLPPLQLRWCVTRLSRTYRNVGTSQYSVLDHSFAVYNLSRTSCASFPARLYALLHDLSESLMGDIPGPLKTAVPKLHLIEDVVQTQLLEQFWPKVPYNIYDLGAWTKPHDKAVYELERNLQLQVTDPKELIETFIDTYEMLYTIVEEGANK